MAEHTQDADDERLDALFAADAIADAGFSKQVMVKVRRQLWIRRLTLPTAAVIGGAFALKPLSALVTALQSVTELVPLEFVQTTAKSMPQTSLIVAGGLLLLVVMLGFRALED